MVACEAIIILISWVVIFDAVALIVNRSRVKISFLEAQITGRLLITIRAAFNITLYTLVVVARGKSLLAETLTIHWGRTTMLSSVALSACVRLFYLTVQALIYRLTSCADFSDCILVSATFAIAFVLLWVDNSFIVN